MTTNRRTPETTPATPNVRERCVLGVPRAAIGRAVKKQHPVRANVLGTHAQLLGGHGFAAVLAAHPRVVLLMNLFAPALRTGWAV